MTEEKLFAWGIRLEYITIGWNILECGFLIWAGIVAGSIAMVGFGVDSIIEIFASLVVVWHLRGIHKTEEKLALRLIAGAFFVVAIYILSQSVYILYSGSLVGTSIPGMVWLLLTVIVMLSLSILKGHIGKKIKNKVLIAESKVTRVDAYLASATLLGVALNWMFGMWWADPLAGLVIVYYGFKEGWYILRGAS